ncbi:MAG: hypothetical protein KZQ90_00170 [Candidatus Thiodiazotropha sp. (ex Codakia rugifera)]|nr:hypothetical protein [Candidatus Thiodiazotropha sp. (ex Codakia rugifera)]
MTLDGFVKNPCPNSRVVVLGKGIAIHGEQRLAGQAGIPHISMFNPRVPG